MPTMSERLDPLPHPVLGDRFTDAFAFAVHLHARQARKSTSVSYLTHLMAVCSLVLEDGGDENQAIAALLHDGPEDQGGQPVLHEIRRRFGDEVAALVDGLTDTLQTPKPKWLRRKRKYLERLMDEPVSVLRVSLADKLHNLRSVATDLAISGDAVWDRFNAGRDSQAWYYCELLAVFEKRLSDSRNLPEFRNLVAHVLGEVEPRVSSKRTIAS
jgi:(p)ppGpp synthase/HD superfamily hydrolase